VRPEAFSSMAAEDKKEARYLFVAGALLPVPLAAPWLLQRRILPFQVTLAQWPSQPEHPRWVPLVRFTLHLEMRLELGTFVSALEPA
jgi:hypothetical protein